jgi:peptidoglycan-associated lipoprotein
VEGHCDERGSVEYNLALGERRAKAAYDYLSSLGVASDRMKTVSYGKEVPLCQEATEECWARNRRDHFAVTGKTAGGR